MADIARPGKSILAHETGQSQTGVYLTRPIAGQVLAFRIRPLVFLRAGRLYISPGTVVMKKYD
ncbi:MAG: hypothetical protein IKV51_00800, partial [Clostridia bacterium]|nr:hypothetical protein [Clostridia bacterium]